MNEFIELFNIYEMIFHRYFVENYNYNFSFFFFFFFFFFVTVFESALIYNELAVVPILCNFFFNFFFFKLGFKFVVMLKKIYPNGFWVQTFVYNLLSPAIQPEGCYVKMKNYYYILVCVYVGIYVLFSLSQNNFLFISHFIPICLCMHL